VAISLYELSIPNYLQILGGVTGVLDKAAECAGESDLDLEQLVNYRLQKDMLPFSFQVISVWHHSHGAIAGLKAGLFQPPPDLGALSYSELRGLVAEATKTLQALSRDEVDVLETQAMKFKMGNFEIPFTAADFIQSFSMPNFYFHATTIYDMLRIQGVPLGKMDFLGAMRVSAGPS
jgi:hypothetical protein